MRKREYNGTTKNTAVVVVGQDELKQGLACSCNQFPSIKCLVTARNYFTLSCHFRKSMIFSKWNMYLKLGGLATAFFELCQEGYLINSFQKVGLSENNQFVRYVLKVTAFSLWHGTEMKRNSPWPMVPTNFVLDLPVNMQGKKQNICERRMSNTWSNYSIELLLVTQKIWTIAQCWFESQCACIAIEEGEHESLHGRICVQTMCSWFSYMHTLSHDNGSETHSNNAKATKIWGDFPMGCLRLGDCACVGMVLQNRPSLESALLTQICLCVTSRRLSSHGSTSLGATQTVIPHFEKRM